MGLALQQAANVPNLPFGAVIVQDGEVIATGFNRAATDPTMHGEIDVIQRAAKHPNVNWSRCTLYTTAEPCPMCQGAILWAGISRVVYGTSIRTLQRLGWRQIDILSSEMVSRTPNAKCEIAGAVCESECDAMFNAAR